MVANSGARSRVHPCEILAELWSLELFDINGGYRVQ